MDEQSLKKIVAREVKTHLAWLKELGFEQPQLSVTGSQVAPAVRATITSATRKIWLDVALPNDDPRALKRHVMVAHLYRLDDTSDDDDADDGHTLYIDWFKAVHRPDLDAKYMKLVDGGGSLENFVRRAMPIYATLFHEDLRPILSGAAWKSGNGDPEVARTFAFLVSDHGFAKPEGHKAGHEQIDTYRRGKTAVSITWDADVAELIAIEIDGNRKAWRMPFRDAAALIKRDPAILEGNFGEIP